MDVDARPGDDLLEKIGECRCVQKLLLRVASLLPGGEKRRLEISRALATNPSFILLDEPFAGVDPIAVEDIQEIVSKLKEKNIGILITDHNVRETLSVCRRAYIMNSGSVIAKGTPERLLNNERVREVYLGENFQI